MRSAVLGAYEEKCKLIKEGKYDRQPETPIATLAPLSHQSEAGYTFGITFAQPMRDRTVQVIIFSILLLAVVEYYPVAFHFVGQVVDEEANVSRRGCYRHAETFV